MTRVGLEMTLVGLEMTRDGARLHLFGHSHVDRRVRSDCATLQDPGKPPAPAMHDPKEFGPPFDADIRKRE
jgi:hypothetical protein